MESGSGASLDTEWSLGVGLVWIQSGVWESGSN